MSSRFVLFHRPPPLLSPRVLTHFDGSHFLPPNDLLFCLHAPSVPSALLLQIFPSCSMASFFLSALLLTHEFKCGFWTQGGQSGIYLSESAIVHLTMISVSTCLPENDFTFILRLMKFHLHISHILFISRYADACISCFHCLTLVNKAAVDSDVQESLWLRICYTPECHSRLFSVSWGTSKLTFTVDVQLTFPPTMCKDSLVPTPWRGRDICFLMNVALTGMK